ncbi:MAG: HAD-IA family hydrolase [Nanoarchaeota archaeon]|jgi:HAD superfamily hydrolase (TIGR01509 family)|nr:HAD-IA family hydrolase [Nanoarchaeota archaeon]
MITKTIIFSTRTICDPTPFIWQGHKQILKKLGANLTKEEIKKMKGQSLQEQLKKINKKFNLNIVYEDFSKQTKELSKDLIKNNLKAFPHIEELLKNARAKSIKIFLASQNLKSNLELYLETMSLQNYFDEIISIEDITDFKPNPEILEIAYKKSNNKPEECVFIDKRKDSIETAKKIGMQTILFENSKQLNDELTELLK